MARIEYRRRDFTILVERHGEETVVRLSAAGRRRQVRVATPRELVETPAFLDLAERWRASLEDIQSSDESLLPRIVLDVRDELWLSDSWEATLKRAIRAPSFAVIRLSRTLPRAGQIPLTLPLRFLETGPGQFGEVRGAVERVLGADEERYASAVQTSEGPPSGISEFLARSGWRTVDVLHVHRLPHLAPGSDFLSTADPERAGTLGWLSRLADVWQTRLVVLSSFFDPYDHWVLRPLAHALAERGGPAVLVVPEGSCSTVYEGLIHDRPLDWICRELQEDLPYAVLVAGAGREEALRPSAIPVRLASPKVQVELTRGTPGALRGFKPFALNVRHMRTFAVTTDYHVHEREGIVPLSERLDELRTQARRENISLESAPLPEGPRHLNARLFSAPGRQIRQARARLSPGRLVHLGIQIGPRDKILQTVGSTAFLEEVVRSSPDPYIEIAVTGIDFLVLGSPVQELKVPARVPTDILYFAVMPHPRKPPLTPGVARLRFSLYHRNHLFQSFRMAALLRDRSSPAPGEERARLAEALGVSEKELPEGDAGFLTRLEYSRLPDFDAVGDLPARAVSFVVNDASGRSVVSVKGRDLFEASLDGNLPGKVEAAREALKGVSSRESLLLPGQLEYAFGEANQGNRESFKLALRKLAEAGWDLYSTLVQGEEARRRVEDNLRDADQVVNACHVDLAKIVPWPLVYDRPYDAERRKEAGMPVEHDTCLAAIGPDGSLRASRCGTHPECLIPDEKRTRRGNGLLLPETVACPLRFWGFKHVVEVPAQQSPRMGDAPPPSADRVTAGQPVRVVAALNSALPLAQTHLTRLQEGIRKVSATLDPGPVHDRDDLLDRLKTLEPDVVYLYCHARRKEGASPAYLEFQRQDGTPGRITVAQIDGKAWSHAPLVFLNGCGTAGLTPTAPSEFIVRLVQQRRAGGVIGAEVEVWEALAGEMALLFLERFLDPAAGMPAGKALLHARRTLLAKNNPLGLVYTLYAPAELRLEVGSGS